MYPYPHALDGQRYQALWIGGDKRMTNPLHCSISWMILPEISYHVMIAFHTIKIQLNTYVAKIMLMMRV
jgi:hypothetical protein